MPVAGRGDRDARYGDVFSGSAAGVGFEPTDELAPVSGFQDRPGRPLRHPAVPDGVSGVSNRSEASMVRYAAAATVATPTHPPRALDRRAAAPLLGARASDLRVGHRLPRAHLGHSARAARAR